MVGAQEGEGSFLHLPLLLPNILFPVLEQEMVCASQQTASHAHPQPFPVPAACPQRGRGWGWLGQLGGTHSTSCQPLTPPWRQGEPRTAESSQRLSLEAAAAFLMQSSAPRALLGCK